MHIATLLNYHVFMLPLLDIVKEGILMLIEIVVLVEE